MVRERPLSSACSVVCGGAVIVKMNLVLLGDAAPSGINESIPTHWSCWNGEPTIRSGCRYVIEAARSGLDSEVLFVYFLQSGKRVGTDEGIVVRAGVTTPKSGRLSTSYGLVDAWCWRNTPLSVRFEF